MEIVTPLVAVGLLLTTGPYATDTVAREPAGTPAVFVLPAPGTKADIDAQVLALPPWLRPRDVDI